MLILCSQQKRDFQALNAALGVRRAGKEKEAGCAVLKIPL